MTDRDRTARTTGARGCLAAGAGAAVLTILSPVVVMMRAWREWRRGTEVTSSLDVARLTGITGRELRRFDLLLDVPTTEEPELRNRLTDTVVRVAEVLRRSDDVYHLVYRVPWDEDATAIPIGPLLQELGERFALVQSQGVLAGRTVVWLTLGRERALAEVIDPAVYDPEGNGEPEALLIHPDLRWSLATAWARTGPSTVIRAIFVVPEESAHRVRAVLGRLA